MPPGRGTGGVKFSVRLQRKGEVAVSSRWRPLSGARHRTLITRKHPAGEARRNMAMSAPICVASLMTEGATSASFEAASTTRLMRPGAALLFAPFVRSSPASASIAARSCVDSAVRVSAASAV